MSRAEPSRAEPSGEAERSASFELTVGSMWCSRCAATRLQRDHLLRSKRATRQCTISEQPGAQVVDNLEHNAVHN